MNCIEICLDRRAFDYVDGCLKEGKAISQSISKAINILVGRVTTYLPPDTDPSRIYDFAGAILPSPTSSMHYKGKDSTLVPVESTIEYTALEIEKYLKQGENKICIFENKVTKPTDPVMKDFQSKTMIHNDEEVYHILTSNESSKEKIIEAMNDSEWLTTLVGVMLELSMEKIERILTVKILDDAMIEEISKKTEKIIVGAYDFEGYLIWSKGMGGMR